VKKAIREFDYVTSTHAPIDSSAACAFSQVSVERMLLAMDISIELMDQSHRRS
jgi:hypothetical protein